MIDALDDTTDERDLPRTTAGASSNEGWQQRLEEIGEEDGYFQPLGTHHWAFFVDESPTLLVSFETAASLRASPEGLPAGLVEARKHGWSHLCLIAEGETWWRDPAVYRFFDRQVDDAFFEDFDRVVFYGAGMGAYAACAFSVTAPGATVIAVQPVATLDPGIASWDRRHRAARRLCFTDRYGYAPDMTEGAGDVFVLFDPHQPYDAIHAALFTRPWVKPLRCRHVGPEVEKSLRQMDVLPQLIAAAGRGALSVDLFARAFRARRENAPYLRRVVTILDQIGRPGLAAQAARSILKRIDAPRIRQKLAEIEGRPPKAAAPAAG